MAWDWEVYSLVRGRIRGHGRDPADGGAKEAAEPSASTSAAAVREGERTESRDGARDAVGRGEVEQDSEAVGDRAADLVEHAGSNSRVRKVEAARGVCEP
jgi:hypothetical protein